MKYFVLSGVIGYVRVEAMLLNGDKYIIYQGGADFIKLPRILYPDATRLYVFRVKFSPIRIHEIVKK
jgi:hypothetical protein